MADEARVTCSLQIRKTSNSVTTLDYQSRPSTFDADVTGTKGPVPGAISVPITGKLVDLSELAQPGLCRMMNLSDTNRLEYGIYDPETAKTYPFGELLAGEMTVFRFSRNFQEEYVGTGTGTSAATNKLWVKAHGGVANVLIECFES